jgi:serine/threonine protein kinase
MSMPTHEIGNAKTIADDSGGLDATIAAESVAPAVTSSPTLPRSLQTTVLPRVDVVGEQPKIVDKARYELSHRLGEGGVGEVLKARDHDIDRDVAIKRLRPEMLASGTALLRFAEEVRTVGRLEHPNIVPIHDVGVHPNGEYFFVMKYVHGETLEAIIDKLIAGDPKVLALYNFERRVEIMMGVLEAIAYAHSQQIIHRDIKPANIMIGPYGEVMVMDWGLARAMHGAEPVTATQDSSPDASGSRKLFETQLGTLLGTPAYMSPEQARGEELDERSDVYSLCMTFYELLALRHPHMDAPSLEVMLEAVKNQPIPHAMMAESNQHGPVPADLSWFLDRGLKKNKSDRFQSVDEMLARLRRRAAGDIPVQCPITFSLRASTMLRHALERRPIFMAAAFILGTITTLVLATLGVIHLVR